MREGLHENKEWFRCSLEKAVEVLVSVITQDKPVSTEQTEKTLTPKSNEAPVIGAYQQVMNALDLACMQGHMDHAECLITEGLWDTKRAAQYVLRKVIGYNIYPWDRDELRPQLLGIIELNLLH